MEWNSFENTYSEIGGRRWGDFISIETFSSMAELIDC